MGREAQVACTLGTKTETVKALLESKELVLRGPTLRRRFELPALQQLRVLGDTLSFTAAGEAVSLDLGAAVAKSWLEKICTPPPTLAAKLGVSATARAAVFGPVADDAELAAALQGVSTDDARAAAMLVAVVLSAEDLAQAVKQHADVSGPSLWVVHAKGKTAALGDAAIRQALRARGYVDNKTTAVSGRLTATRYRRPEGPRFVSFQP